MFKIGLELMHNTLAVFATAPKDQTLRELDALRELIGLTKEQLFYDGKFMDIPNTVAGASKAPVKLGAKMFNVHTLGGAKMLEDALKVAKKSGENFPLVLGVTALTSLSHDDFVQMGIFEPMNIANPSELQEAKDRELSTLVKDLALFAQEFETWEGGYLGLDGVIASPRELPIIRRYCQPEFLVVTPGVRPAWAAKGDQKRVMTPREAIALGADYIVVGRPITNPPPEIGSPERAVDLIAEEIRQGLEDRRKQEAVVA